MALNKFMHPRNKYRKPPDFKALAIKHADFRKYAKQDISGKVSLNFKDLETIRALTTTLLKEDFGLDVEIPMSRLIPTLPLRLNYLLWLEDMLRNNNKQPDNIRGIDIGCGASCVYSLLAAKEFGWKMLATEVDTDSAFVASGNVKRNKLQDMINVRVVDEGTILAGVLEPDTVYDFCMCNPPFFSSVDELDPKNVARSSNRPLPRNAHSGATGELVAPGGEIGFVNKIVKDSLKLKDSIKIFSVMLGHKSSVGQLKKTLRDVGVSEASIANSTFCQGRTTRWGLAWTLDPDTNMVMPQNAPGSEKKKTPFSHTVELDMPSLLERLKELMVKLEITCKTLKENNELCAMEITAMTNAWCNSRKKRREEKFKMRNIVKDSGSSVEVRKDATQTEEIEMKEADSPGIEKNAHAELSVAQENPKELKNVSHPETCEKEPEKLRHDEEVKKEPEKMNQTLAEERNNNKRPYDEKGSPKPSKKPKFDSNSSEPIFVGSLIAKKNEGGTELDLCWIRGIGGRDSAHQILQYFKNGLKVQNTCD